MKYALLSQLDALTNTDSLLVGLCGKSVLPADLPEAVQEAVQAAAKRGDAKNKAGHSFVISNGSDTGPGRIIVVGCGDKAANLDLALRDKAIAAGTTAALALGSKRLVVALAAEQGQAEPELALRRAVQTAGQACYRFTECKSSKPEARALKTLGFVAPAGLQPAAARTALEQAEAVVEGLNLACDLGNRPGNRCTPTDLANCAENMAADFKGLKCKVLGEAEMADLGMGALLSVSRGSREEARLIVLEWNGGKKGQKPVALVGKGLTFDAGGISLKPAAKMEEMKFDMMGGGTVLGTMRAIAQMKLPLNVVAVVAASENLPDGAANKPGDIVTSLAGLTIEVINTDAEGRLILCDALTWVQREYEPSTIVDLATLTGACVVALGEHACGLYANDQSLADELVAAGTAAGDRAWQMPLWEDYQQQLDSPVADMQNVGGPGGGSITAACFLHRFTRKARWAHLDIAGVAWTSKKLASGRPVNLLVQWLLNQSR
ncbi:MAG: leucyl aminopeptidase [Oceanococcaceae bacterium]